jgi:hypothetical protein
MPTGKEQGGTPVNTKRKRDNAQVDAQAGIEKYLINQAAELEASQPAAVRGLTFNQRVRLPPSATATLQPPHNLTKGAHNRQHTTTANCCIPAIDCALTINMFVYHSQYVLHI